MARVARISPWSGNELICTRRAGQSDPANPPPCQRRRHDETLRKDLNRGFSQGNGQAGEGIRSVSFSDRLVTDQNHSIT
jgi:hypothetical protein